MDLPTVDNSSVLNIISSDPTTSSVNPEIINPLPDFESTPATCTSLTTFSTASTTIASLAMPITITKMKTLKELKSEFMFGDDIKTTTLHINTYISNIPAWCIKI